MLCKMPGGRPEEPEVPPVEPPLKGSHLFIQQPERQRDNAEVWRTGSVTVNWRKSSDTMEFPRKEGFQKCVILTMYVFMYLKVELQKDTHSHILHLLVHAPNKPGYSWEPGASLGSPKYVARVQACEPSSATLSRSFARSWLRSKVAET